MNDTRPPLIGSASASLPSSEQLAAIIEIAADAIVSADDQQRIALFNRGAEVMFGYAAAEVIGQPLGILLPEEFRAEHGKRVDEFGRAGAASRLMGHRRPIPARRKSGEIFHAEVSIAHVRIDGRSVYAAVLRDVSERERADAERRTLLAGERGARALAERAAAHARFLARAGAVLDASLDYETTLTTLSHLLVPELASLCLLDVLDEDGAIRRLKAIHADAAHTDIADALAAYPKVLERPFLTREALLQGRSTLVEQVTAEQFRLIAHDEAHLALWRRVRPTSYVCAPLLARGRTLGAIALVAGEGEEAYDNDDLALLTEVAARAAMAVDNARLYRQARRATNLRDEVLGIVSHDLRTPVATMAMALSGLERQPHGKDSEVGHLIHLGRESVDWMSRLIQDLLDVASIDAGKLSIERRPEDLDTVLAEAAAFFRGRMEERRIQFLIAVPEDLPAVEVDAGRIRQLVGNLLSNAAKFTAPDGRVTLSARALPASIIVDVEDTGPGIPAEEIGHVFDRFWHARRSNRERGTGLGLSIARGIIEAHGGRIWVESGVGVGSKFSFEIPIATPNRVLPLASDG